MSFQALTPEAQDTGFAALTLAMKILLMAKHDGALDQYSRPYGTRLRQEIGSDNDHARRISLKIINAVLAPQPINADTKPAKVFEWVERNLDIFAEAAFIDPVDITVVIIESPFDYVDHPSIPIKAYARLFTVISYALQFAGAARDAGKLESYMARVREYDCIRRHEHELACLNHTLDELTAQHPRRIAARTDYADGLFSMGLGNIERPEFARYFKAKRSASEAPTSEADAKA